MKRFGSIVLNGLISLFKGIGTAGNWILTDYIRRGIFIPLLFGLTSGLVSLKPIVGLICTFVGWSIFAIIFIGDKVYHNNLKGKFSNRWNIIVIIAILAAAFIGELWKLVVFNDYLSYTLGFASALVLQIAVLKAIPRLPGWKTWLFSDPKHWGFALATIVPFLISAIYSLWQAHWNDFLTVLTATALIEAIGFALVYVWRKWMYPTHKHRSIQLLVTTGLAIALGFLFEIMVNAFTLNRILIETEITWMHFAFISFMAQWLIIIAWEHRLDIGSNAKTFGKWYKKHWKYTIPFSLFLSLIPIWLIWGFSLLLVVSTVIAMMSLIPSVKFNKGRMTTAQIMAKNERDKLDKLNSL